MSRPADRPAGSRTATAEAALSEKPLADRVALVTGASRGIGRAIAEAFARAGASVVLAARSEDDLARVASAIEKDGASAHAIRCDVSRPEDAAAAVESSLGRFGRLDILVNNAGIGASGRIEDLPIETWDRAFAVNLRGVFLMTKAAVPAMKRLGGGHIVNISSVAGLVGNPKLSAYNATKFGLMGFSEALMLELRHDRIKVSVICPGSTDTHFGGHEGGTRRPNALAPSDVAHAALAVVTAAPDVLISQVHVRCLIPPERG